jgi:hypothetical protein
MANTETEPRLKLWDVLLKGEYYLNGFQTAAITATVAALSISE